LHQNLPHISLDDHYQFVTFRTKDSIDDFLKSMFFADIDNKIKQYKIDQHLDRSSNGNYLNGKVIDEIRKYFLSYDKKLYDLVAFSIMPNHIHILFKQKEKLSEILRILKGGSAHITNKILQRKGKVWAGKYYDVLIRDEKHFATVYKYIKNNPIKANLNDDKKRFYGIYE
jgi:REP element-mobilizing transposase RayT